MHFVLGQAYLLTGENNLAKESFEHAVSLYPGQVDARRSLAAPDSQSGRHQQARARLDDLLKQRPDDVAALNMLMMLDLVTKNWVEAEHTLNRLPALLKDSAVVFMAEGRLREAQRQYDKASAVYERAIALAPNDPDSLLSLVKLDIVQGHADRAKTRLDLQHKRNSATWLPPRKMPARSIPSLHDPACRNQNWKAHLRNSQPLVRSVPLIPSMERELR